MWHGVYGRLSIARNGMEVALAILKVYSTIQVYDSVLSCCGDTVAQLEV